MDTEVAPPHDRRLLAVVMLGAMTTGFPFTVLAASLDTIRIDLHTSLATISWLQIAPTLAGGVALPIFGKLCDLWGAHRLFLFGVGMTVIMSALTAAAWNAPSLIALRTLGQLVATAAGPAGFALVSAAMDGPDRARSIGRVGSATAIAPILGVTLGGPLVDWLGWQMLFLVQAMPAAVCFGLALRWLPHTARGHGVSFDFAGAALLGSSVTTALFALNRVRVWGIDHPAVVGCFIAAPLLGGALIAVEQRRSHPLVPLAFLRRRDVGFSLLALWFLQVVFLGGSIAIPLLLHRRFGYGVTAVAYLAVLRPLGYTFGSAWSPRLRRAVGGPSTQVIGAALFTVASAVLAVLVGFHVVALLAMSFVFAGFACGLTYTAVLTSVNELADPRDIGVANGVASMVATVAQGVGITLVASMIGDSQSRSAFVGTFAAMVVGALLTTAMATIARPRGVGRAVSTAPAPA